MRHFTFLDADGRRCFSDCVDGVLPDYADCWLPRAPLPDEIWDGKALVWEGERVKAETMAKVNAEAERRILRDYPWHKQMNDKDNLLELAAPRVAKKDAVRLWSNKLNARVAKAKNGTEIAAILAELNGGDAA